MPSHFSTIGLQVDTEDEFVALAHHLAEEADSIPVSGGRYLCWSSNSGAEIWIQVDTGNDLIGMMPHFSGESRVRVALTSRVTRPKDSQLDGAFAGWADPREEEEIAGAYPLVIDSPDYQRQHALALPSVVTMQIAAFAHELQLYDSKQAYDEAQTTEPRFASRSFIPSGMFSADGSDVDPPQAYGIFTGHVVKSTKKHNELTGHSFYWALVDSLGGQFDVVVDPELLPQPPKVGGVLSGSFWLSGRMVY